MPFKWPKNFHMKSKAYLIIGDFKSHSFNLNYNDTNSDDKAVELWAATLGLANPVFDEKRQRLFLRCTLEKKTYNPTIL